MKSPHQPASSLAKQPSAPPRRYALALLLGGTGLLFSPLAFWLGRQRGKLRAQTSAAASTVEADTGASSVGASPETAQGRTARPRRSARDIDRAAEALRLALATRQDQLDSPVARLAIASAEESPAAREGRHRDLAQIIDEKYPRLSPEKRAVFMAINDRVDTHRRVWRANFMLDQMSEDAYEEALKDDVRVALTDARQALTPEESSALLGDVPADPFAPTAARTPEEAPLANAELLQSKIEEGEKESAKEAENGEAKAQEEARKTERQSSGPGA